MYYQIRSIETEEQSGLTYSVVDFWRTRVGAIAGRDPLATEDFLSDLRDTADQIVTDAEGRLKLVDGAFVAPGDLDPTVTYTFQRETVALDPAQQLIDNIERFLDNNEEAMLAGSFARSRVSLAIRVRSVAERDPLLSDTRLVALRNAVREARERRAVR